MHQELLKQKSPKESQFPFPGIARPWNAKFLELPPFVASDSDKPNVQGNATPHLDSTFFIDSWEIGCKLAQDSDVP